MKILYVGYTLIGDNDATGYTLNNIFNNKLFENQIQQVCLDYSPKHHSSILPVCYVSRYKSFLYYVFKSLYRNDKITQPQKNPLFSDSQRIGGNCLIALARAILDVLPKGLSSEDKKRIAEFKPDVIYTLGENIYTLRMSLDISAQFNVPIVLHMMDNIEDCVYSYHRLLWPFRSTYIKYLNKLYERCVENIAISPKMAMEFSKRHGIHFDYAMNCIEALNCIEEKTVGRPIRLVFSGGLHGGRADTLKVLSSIINKDVILSQEYSLSIFTSQNDIKQFSAEFERNVQISEYVPRDKMFENLNSFDILLHVESFKINQMKFFEYSMSTKIPEYLSTGKPILCIGPECSCSVSYLLQNECAIVVTNINQVKQILNEIAIDSNILGSVGRKALEVVQQDFTQSQVSERVHKVFQNVISKWNSI